MSKLNRSVRYRNKALELRVIAEDDENEPTRHALIGVAEVYEQIARSMEQIEESRERLENRGSGQD